MVGRPGRSKGCVTCRHRRVKCDETKPFCKRCKLATYTCAGYKETSFIDEGSRFKSSTPLNPLVKWPHVDFMSKPKHELPVFESVASGPDGFASGLTLLACSDPMSIPLALVGTGMDYYTAYTLKSGRSPLAWYGIDDPIQYDSMLHIQSPLGKYSLQAVAAAFFGKMHSRPDIISEGSREYCRALRLLQKQLADPAMATSMDSLLSIDLLGVYEFLCRTTASGWLHHALGFARLVELRGPEAHSSIRGLQMLERNRSNMITAAIVRHERTFLAQPEWKSIPWSRNPGAKSALQLLLDTMVELPGMLEYRDKLLGLKKAASPEAGPLTSRVRERLLQLMHELHEWRTNWQIVNAKEAFETQSSRIGNLENIFPTSIHFTHPDLSSQITLYNSALILFCVIIQSLDLDLSNAESNPFGHCGPSPLWNEVLTPSIFPINNLRETMWTAAIEICRCVDMHFASSGATLFFLIAPLRVAWPALGGYSTREGHWVRSIIGQIGTREQGGWKLAEHMMNHDPFRMAI